MSWPGKALLAFAWLLVACAGCDSSQSGAPQTPATPQGRVTLQPLRDPWPQARQRWWDIADQPYSVAFQRRFSYSATNVVLQWHTQPATKYFRGHLSARGLKPNFAYQMKLVGKPSGGVRGWKTLGDDVANERLGRATRWWDDTDFRNVTDAWYNAYYRDTMPQRRHTIYGYQFIGIFVTDERGTAEVPIEAQPALHITWQDWQSGYKDVEAGTWPVGSTTPPYDGYGQRREPRLVKLWYEWEKGRSRTVRLPPGIYNCRFVLTEETFHNDLGGTRGATGGYWPTVLGSEAVGDTNPQNDVVFAIR